MKGICLPLDPTGKWGGGIIMKPLKTWDCRQILPNVEPEQHPAPRSSHRTSCRSGVFTGIKKPQLLPRLCLGWGWKKARVALLQSPSLISASLSSPILLGVLSMLSLRTTPTSPCRRVKTQLTGLITQVHSSFSPLICSHSCHHCLAV